MTAGAPDGSEPTSSNGSPGSPGSLRARNVRRVLDAVLDAPGASLTQAELTRATGLAAGTVSSIVRELSEANLLDTIAGSGRRGTRVGVSHEAGLVGGVDFGHQHLRVALGDLTGRIVAERRVPLDPGAEHEVGLRLAVDLLDVLLAEKGAHRDDLRNIGLGLPAPIADDVVMAPAILPGWVGVNAREATEKWFGREVHLDNDANLGALAEHRQGAGRGSRTMVYVKASSGVGAGIIIDGQIFRGAGGTSGELGHLTLDEDGPVCRCGSRGCLEAYAAASTAIDLLADQLPGASFEDLVSAAREGNAAATRVFEDAGTRMGWGLAAVANLINPELIVVGGDMALAGDLYLEAARSGLRRHSLTGAGTTPVVPAQLGERVSAVGAVQLAIEWTDLLA